MIVPMCGWAVAAALGHSHTVGVGESGHELGNGSYNSLPEQRALCAAQTPRRAARAADRAGPAARPGMTAKAGLKDAPRVSELS